MGRYTTRKTLERYCAQAGITLYAHKLDGASYQYCAGGYVVNGYLGRLMLLSSLQYRMQQKLILLLKTAGAGKVTLIGIRKAESARRAK